MFGALKLWGLRRKLRGSLAADPLQVGWDGWLDGAQSVLQLHTSCSNPGWLMHCAYWSGEEQNKILEAALVMAQLAIDHGPPNVMTRETVMDLRQVAFPDIAEIIIGIEARYPAIVGIERALPGVSTISMHHLYDARLAHRHTGEFSGEELVKAGKAGAAAAGFSLALQTLFHRQFGMREPLTLSAAGAGALFTVAMPDHRNDLMALVRDRFGWQHAMASATITK